MKIVRKIIGILFFAVGGILLFAGVFSLSKPEGKEMLITGLVLCVIGYFAGFYKKRAVKGAGEGAADSAADSTAEGLMMAHMMNMEGSGEESNSGDSGSESDAGADSDAGYDDGGGDFD